MGFIYKIENQINHKVYIGQTKRTIGERWIEHLEMHHPEVPLYRAFIKYGISNFFIEQIEECPNENLDEREIFWINYYNSFENGYNATRGGSTPITIDYAKVIDIFLKTKSTSQTALEVGCNPSSIRYILNLYHIPHSCEKAIEMIDPETKNVIRTFDSLTEAADFKSEWNIGTISSAVSGKRNSAYGYFWRNEGDINKTFNPLFKQNRKIAQYDKKGNFIKNFSSIAEANRALGKVANHHSISNALNGKSKTALGFIWKYLD